MKRKRKKQKRNGKLTLGKKNVRDPFFMALSITSNLLLASSSNPDSLSQNSQLDSSRKEKISPPILTSKFLRFSPYSL